jgi:hypothetical protein
MNSSIRNILPDNLKNYKNIIIPLIESAALSLKFEKVKLYNYNDFILKMHEKYNGFKRVEKPAANAFDLILNKFKSHNDLFNINQIEYENILGLLLNSVKDNQFYSKTLLNIFPTFIPVKIAFLLLDKYFIKS